tara:strand:- start:276 stop:437 length:162 start_codon:yes stop_codon:yes gene_type:complete
MFHFLLFFVGGQVGNAPSAKHDELLELCLRTLAEGELKAPGELVGEVSRSEGK